MTTTANPKRLLMSGIGLLSAATVASPLLFRADSASANCQVSSTALEVVKLTNQVRSEHSLKPLRSNCLLFKAAQNHTEYMVKTGTITHTGSDGSSVGVRVKRVGYEYSAVAENVASEQQNPSQVVDSWMNSSGHRKNILNPNYTEIGVGYSNNYWTQVFGRSL